MTTIRELEEWALRHGARIAMRWISLGCVWEVTIRARGASQSRAVPPLGVCASNASLECAIAVAREGIERRLEDRHLQPVPTGTRLTRLP